jgi:hypothetical protein
MTFAEVMFSRFEAMLLYTHPDAEASAIPVRYDILPKSLLPLE